MEQERPKDPTLGIDLKGNFNFMCNITCVGATCVRPLLLSGHGTRAYGLDAVVAFVAMPVIATFTQAKDIELYWYVWCVAVILRKLTADRREHTDYWGHNRILAWLTFGHHRLFEPLAVALAAFLVAPHSMALARLIGFGALSLAFQYRISAEVVKRRREAIHNAAIDASRYL